jgi:co-chaperonin GroES (HSP10)
MVMLNKAMLEMPVIIEDDQYIIASSDDILAILK